MQRIVNDEGKSFRSWGAKAILTGIIFPAILASAGWFSAFVSSVKTTQAEVEALKKVQNIQYENLTSAIIDLKNSQKEAATDIREVRSFLLPARK